MSITRYDPFREAMSLRNAIDQLFSQSFVNPSWTTQTPNAPMDVYEDEHGYKVSISLPGVRPEDIDVTVHQNTLNIKGEYKHEIEPEQQQAQEKPRGNWLVREISSGSYQRSITFDRPIDLEHIETNYEHGMLTINLPVTESSRPKRIEVRSGAKSQQVPVEAGKRQK
ncbi:HSP20 family protein [Thermosporothrix hazakensis]|jgi:HSP20 family protein|uniref:HSP20 family protein n=2 Tax=Thermosporothrix TaxID=768650 RepID=A0A326UE64_THEHA|nr:Hsp20/alpha crystallin family protein [Thermosporothrix hazakensis]PZW24729.1 HSP20 family protein [Thermosporothrix hazakensis]BBH90287.1 molecular chaperone Hsp20 [Thermosporothrix sp. COM3]GCE48324.1 molecular chaperone Hsp20 [Thermosporothrix hazakensis]